jgi:hypothetical protein
MPVALGLLAIYFLRVRDPRDWIGIPAALGLAAVIPAEIIERWARTAITQAFPDTHPEAAGRSLDALWNDHALSASILRGSVGAALPEELAMACLFFGWLLTRRRIERMPVTGIILAGSVVALSFAAFENVYFLSRMGLSAELVVGRSFLATPSHFVAGLGFGTVGAIATRPEQRPRAAVWIIGITVLAVLSHATYDVTVMCAATLQHQGLLSYTVGLVLATAAFAVSAAIVLVPTLTCYRRTIGGWPVRSPSSAGREPSA